jgi:predicted AAA+ superfamily ATPase
VISRNTLLEILADQRLPVVPGRVLDRELIQLLPSRSSQALVLTGVRRAGKSVMQTQLMRNQERLFYCNLEDTRLYDLTPQDFPTLLTLIDEQAPSPARVFLDEVQEVEGWQRLVRTLLDRGRPVCLTGSNASLLGRELGSKLTGRHLSFEVFPFSYTEYLAYTQQMPGAASVLHYLDDGGFPGFLRERNPQILQELLRDIVQRDIAVRYRLREIRHLMNLVLFLLANTGQPFSMQGLTKSLSVPTVAQTSRYLQYMEDAYLLFSVPKFSPSFKKRVVTPNKYYAVDNGLRRVNSPQSTADVGHRLENAIFLALRRNKTPVSYAGEANLWECDFVTDTAAIQVCATLDAQNQEREVRGVVRAAALPGRRRAIIITLDQRDHLTQDNTTIEVIPAWEWLTASAVPHA